MPRTGLRIARLVLLAILLSSSVQQTSCAPVSPPGQPGAASAAPLQIELVVRTINNFKTDEDVVGFFRLAKKSGVTAVHVNVKQDEDDERPSGEVYYASRLAPVAAGYEQFDVLAAAVAQGRRLGIRVYAWMPQFHDQAAMRLHPQWQMQSAEQGASRPYQGKETTEFFINPIDPAVQAYQRSLIEEVARNYQVDGISLDWLRFDDLNMDTGDYTRQLARQEIGIDPLTIDFSRPSAASALWQRWRTRKIGDYVRSVRQMLDQVRPQAKLGVFLLPPEFTEVGQDLSLFSGDLDEALPMAYFMDWGLPSQWVNSRLLHDVERKKSAATSIKPTLDGTGTLQQNVDILRGIKRTFPHIRAVAWFSAVYWQAADMERIAAMHRAAGSAEQGRAARK
ncbi:family 10 glycosylhydrolase [Herbaspirillum sp. YR522]|uniref:family 10 glycosylhydrolase n=1 Tax=Herbaspirillum sp. YR522 TaxID=1144342 RepID=UPI0012F8A57F|nr:family 10 glycosylhydrolase [Herbaspirillum sp. YR522]